MEQRPWKERVMQKKWESLKKRGIQKPRTKKENSDKLKEARD